MGEVYAVAAKAVGKEIMMARKKKGFSQKKLADALHVQERTISEWEKGKSLPMGRSQLTRISNELQIPVSKLVSTKQNDIFKEGGVSAVESKLTYHPSIPAVVTKDLVNDDRPFHTQLVDRKNKENLSINDIAELLYGEITEYYKRRVWGFMTKNNAPTENEFKKLCDIFSFQFNKPAKFGTPKGMRKVKKDAKLVPAPVTPKIAALKQEVKVEEEKPCSVSNIDRVFVENVKKICVDKNGEAELCGQIGIAPGFFFRDRIDQAPMTIELLVKVHNYLHASYDDLLHDPKKDKIKSEIAAMEAKIKALREQLKEV